MFKPQHSVALIAAIPLCLIVAASAAAQTTLVFVPGNTLGGFGNPSVDGNQPYVTGIVATAPGTIVVTYVSGTVTDGPTINTGPDGAPWNMGTGQTPMQEAAAISGGEVGDIDALIGIFVPKARVAAQGFSPVDGAKPLAPVGLLPSKLFFIGTGKTFTVRQAGTLFLGINDDNAATNGGGFLVLITFTPAS